VVPVIWRNSRQKWAEELFYRAGGLVKVYPIPDESLILYTNASRSSHMERLPGIPSREEQDDYSTADITAPIRSDT